MLNILVTGVGGQGTVLFARLIGSAAISSGYAVKGTETIGMAQRGGSVVSHLRIGELINSPLIPLEKADLIIAFEPAEAVRSLPYLSKEGKLLTLDAPIQPVTASLTGKGYEAAEMLGFLKANVSNLSVLSSAELARGSGSAKVINVAMLGFVLAKGWLPFEEEALLAVLNERIPKRFLELNIKALNTGKEYAQWN
ncbi:MAG: indolepyruvate oxidoreductase subunit beta [Oscillospiraceae bacterium]|jgi:indolepyruvate ferredoxin oxidoreductase beta subunit|nr:indolepyruvate oxidoreductase subunit beta [Oscillospiraceae bacterium]